MKQNFIDHVSIYIKSGDGGRGASHFRREKHVPKGGPDGGDGGRGGHIILKGNSQLWTLLHLRYKKHLIAENGVNGSGQRATGANGRDIYVEVPLGTVVKNYETGAYIGEVTDDGQEYIVAEGGMGGLGNWHFRTSTTQAPTYAQPGKPGLEMHVAMELKLLADVGLVGFPNVGKSTLLSVVSAAKPEIANYEFTTKTPNVGVVSYRDHRSFVMADIPGIIEGAAEGKGLGIRFLRHIERNAALLFIIPADSDDIKKDFGILLNELKKYNPELLDKERILGISKSDLLDDELIAEMKNDLPEGIKAIFFSSVTQLGIQTLKDELWSMMIQRS